MRRGEIRLIDFEPARGSEVNDSRPAIIVSNDGANTTAARLRRGVLTVIPITTNTERVYPFQVALHADDTGLNFDSKAQAEQIRAVAFERIGPRLGALTLADMTALDDAIRVHLAL